MVITKSEFDEYVKAQEHYFSKCSGTSPKPLAIVRKKMTTMETEKFIYIYDHYDELKERFGYA